MNASGSDTWKPARPGDTPGQAEPWLGDRSAQRLARIAQKAAIREEKVRSRRWVVYRTLARARRHAKLAGTLPDSTPGDHVV